MNLAAYVLTIHSPEPEPAQGSGPRLTDDDKRVLANLPALLEAAEEDLTDLLPEGYRVRIVGWNSPGPDYQPAGIHWMRDVTLQEPGEET